MSNLIEFGWLGLLLASFLAATILPLSSEVVLAGLLVAGQTPSLLIICATIGNVLGSLVNYALGYWASQSSIRHKLNISDKAFERAEKRFEKYGLFALCFAWVPVIGDPLTVLAGALRIKLFWFILLVTLGKLGRYFVVTYLTLQTM